jgi:membrane-bound metal-dependent hydrolase YbcI (DUF457 family)
VALFRELKETLASIVFLIPNLPHGLLPMDVKIKTLGIETRNMYPVSSSKHRKINSFLQVIRVLMLIGDRT